MMIWSFRAVVLLGIVLAILTVDNYLLDRWLTEGLAAILSS